MDYEEKTIGTKRIYDGKIIKLRVDDVLLPDGRKSTREIVEHPGGVAVVAVRDGEIVMVRQFRKPAENTLLEIPAGKLEAGEDPYDCAVRELEEETGLKAESLKLLSAIYTSPGFSNERLYIYLAKNITEGTLNRDEDEFMDICTYKVDRVLDMINDGTINDAKTICGVLMYVQNLK